MSDMTSTKEELLLEIQGLCARLEEAEETLRAIRYGEVDALVVSTPEGEQAFTLTGAEHAYRMMVETMTEGAITLALEGTILYVNSSFAEMIRTPLEKVIGTAIQDIVAGEDRPRFDALLAQSRERPARAEIKLRSADGAAISTLISTKPLREREVRFIVAVITDLSPVYAGLEARLRLAAIIESTDDAIIGKTLDGVITNWNRGAQEMYGYTAGEAIGQPMSILMPPGHEDELSTIMKTIKEGRRLKHFETRRRTKDGKLIDVSLGLAPIKEANGKLIGAAAVVRDVSERKRAEEEVRRLNTELEQRVEARTAELRAANAELDSFAYAVSHDLRAPLRAMIGFSQALEEDCGERLDGAARGYIDQITLASRHMGGLIDGLLTLSRSTRGELKQEVLDLSALAERLLADAAAAEPGRQVAWSVEPGMLTEGDAAMIEVVMRNLIDNAWKYTGKTPDARIRVYPEVSEGQRCFCVSDNGAGFDMAYAGKLFQPFQRLHRQEEFTGIGIGLATVQRIVRRHGGAIWAEGAPDKGATFRFTLHNPRPADKEAT